MLNRALTIPLHRAAQLGQPVLLQGPRGAGKTALLRREFPAHTYVTMEDSADRARARQHPAQFLGSLRGPAIFDDLHRAPELVAHIAAIPDAGRLLLASSRRLQLPVAALELYWPTRAELAQRAPISLAMLGNFVPAPTAPRATSSSPQPKWPAARSFLQHDVRDLVQVREMDHFEKFLAEAEARSGQVLHQQSLADACGLSHRTVVRWLQVLDTCFRTITIPASEATFGRRTIRAPRLHFLDSPTLESQVVSELYRNARHTGPPSEAPEFSHWQDSNGLQCPLLVTVEGAQPMPVVIAKTPSPLEEQRLRRWMDLAAVSKGALIGEQPSSARHGGRHGGRTGVLRYWLGQL